MATSFKTITVKTSLWLARVKEPELNTILQQQSADGWKFVNSITTTRGLRPRAFNTLVFTKES